VHLASASRAGDNADMKKKPGRKPDTLDANQMAAAILRLSTGEPTPAPEEPAAPPKNPAAVELGRLGGKKGGAARAAAMTPKQRSEAARKAARSRWQQAMDRKQRMDAHSKDRPIDKPT
jgi:hypothetical protein